MYKSPKQEFKSSVGYFSFRQIQILYSNQTAGISEDIPIPSYISNDLKEKDG